MSFLATDKSTPFNECTLPTPMYLPGVVHQLNSKYIFIMGSDSDRKCYVFNIYTKQMKCLGKLPLHIRPASHSVKSCQNLIVSHGGGNQDSEHFLFFDTETNKWITDHQRSSLQSGVGFASVFIQNEYTLSPEIHVIGGHKHPSAYRVWNHSIKKWKRGPDIPVSLTYHGLVHIQHTADSQEQLIVFGGCNLKKGWLKPQASKEVFSYRIPKYDGLHSPVPYNSSSCSSTSFSNTSPHQNSSSLNSRQVGRGSLLRRRFSSFMSNENKDWVQLSSMPVELQNFGYVLLNNKYIVVCGGDTGDKKGSDSIYIYDVNENQWMMSNIRLPHRVFGCSVVSTREELHIFGGRCEGKKKCDWHWTIPVGKLLDGLYESECVTEYDLTTCDWETTKDDNSLYSDSKYNEIEKQLEELRSEMEDMKKENENLVKENMRVLEKLAIVSQTKEELKYDLDCIKDKQSYHRLALSSKYGMLNATIGSCSMSGLKSVKESMSRQFGKQFIAGVLGLPQYIKDFESIGLLDITKLAMDGAVNDKILEFNAGIDNAIHRKLIVKLVQDLKFETAQFRNWFTSHEKLVTEECDNEKPRTLYEVLHSQGVVSWKLLASCVSTKKDLLDLFGGTKKIAKTMVEKILCELGLYLSGGNPIPCPGMKLSLSEKDISLFQETDYNSHSFRSNLGIGNGNSQLNILDDDSLFSW